MGGSVYAVRYAVVAVLSSAVFCCTADDQRENRRRIAYDYKEGDKILILSSGLDPKLKLHEGPYKVLGVNKSTGTLHIRRKGYTEPINIRNVRPYFGALRGGD